MADFNDKNLLTADLAFTNFGTGKRASNLTESNSIPKKVMTVDGPRVFSSANCTPSSAQMVLQVLRLLEHSLELGGGGARGKNRPNNELRTK